MQKDISGHRNFWSESGKFDKIDSNILKKWRNHNVKNIFWKYKNTRKIYNETYEYADSRKYFSWEEFYTDYLVQNTKDTIYQYSKKKLPLAYLTTGSMKRIQNQIPEKIVKAVKVRH